MWTPFFRSIARSNSLFLIAATIASALGGFVANSPASEHEPVSIRIYRELRLLRFEEHAQVLLYDQLPGQASPPAPDADPDEALAWMTPRSISLTTDANGLVDLPPIHGIPSLFISAQDARVWLRHEKLERHHFVQLVPTSGWLVKVLDARGHAAQNVCVSLARYQDHSSCVAPTSGYETVTTSITDEQGHALLPSLRWLDPERTMFEGLSTTSHFAVRPLVRGTEQDWVPIDWEDHETGSLELQLPPTGSVEVRLWDAEGVPVREDATVRVEGPLGARWSNRGKHLVTMERVALGQELALTAHTPYETLRSESVSVQGPRAAGETIYVDVRMQPRNPTITARFVDEMGSPVANQDIDISWSAPPQAGTNRQYWAETDDQGFARFHGQAAIDQLTLEFSELHRTAPDSIFRAGRVIVAGGVGAEDIDLGDVTLTERPLLVAGRAFDSSGDPMAHASILCWRVDTGPPGRDALRSAPAGSWQIGRTNSKGRFHVRAESPDVLWQVELVTGKHNEAVFLPGQRDLVIRERSIDNLCFIRPQWLIGEAVPNEALELIFREVGKPRSLFGEQQRHLSGPAEYALRPGTYVPWIVCHQHAGFHRSPLDGQLPSLELPLDTIEIAEGQVDHDLTVDLRDRLTVFRLQVVGSTGDYQPGITCRIHRVSDGALVHEARTNMVGRIRFLGPRDEYTYEILSSGNKRLGGGKADGSIRHVFGQTTHIRKSGDR